MRTIRAAIRWPFISSKTHRESVIKFLLGFDRREEIVYKVARHSLLKTTPSADIMPLVQDQLRAWGIYDREDSRAATDFSLTRFLVPQLMHYEGWAVFADCDFLFTRNVIDRLAQHLDRKYPLFCVKHNYEPKSDLKMDGKRQWKYPRKNWSSFMVFNCGHEANRVLHSGVINVATASWLHQFGWLDNYEIGELPTDFNFLVGEYEAPDGELAAQITKHTALTPTCLHYTLGIGAFEPPTQDYVKLWEAERDQMKVEEQYVAMAQRH